jgi:ribosomal protein S12 methylthiotransferase accessory factor YcaO
MGCAKGAPAKTEVDESTDGLLEIMERACAFQIKTMKSDPSSFQFGHSVEEVDKKGEYPEMIEKLQNENFCYIKFDGTMMEW